MWPKQVGICGRMHWYVGSILRRLRLTLRLVHCLNACEGFVGRWRLQTALIRAEIHCVCVCVVSFELLKVLVL